jgi:hypothetical protein
MLISTSFDPTKLLEETWIEDTERDIEGALHNTNESETQMESSDDVIERRIKWEVATSPNCWPDAVITTDPEVGMVLELWLLIETLEKVFVMGKGTDRIFRAALEVSRAEIQAESWKDFKLLDTCVMRITPLLSTVKLKASIELPVKISAGTKTRGSDVIP